MTENPTPRGGPRRGQAVAALRAHLAGQETPALRQDALAVHEVLTGAERSALVERLERMHAAATLGELRTLTARQVEDLRLAALALRVASDIAGPLLADAADEVPAARAADPETSTLATPDRWRRGNHLERLLVGFRMFERQQHDRLVGWNGYGPDDVDSTLTSEELAARVEMLHTEYAKRCSDLKALGLIRVAQDSNGHDRTRRGEAGPQRLVFELTDDGRRLADELAARRR